MDNKRICFCIMFVVLIVCLVCLMVMQVNNTNTIKKQALRIDKLERENDTFEQYVSEYIPDSFRKKYDKEHDTQMIVWK